MEIREAVDILKVLAGGVDPITGEVFAEDGPYNRPKVVRALFLAVSALERGPSVSASTRKLPEKAGASWDTAEDERLVAESDSGASIMDMASRHQRTNGAIRARLKRLGKIIDDVH